MPSLVVGLVLADQYGAVPAHDGQRGKHKPLRRLVRACLDVLYLPLRSASLAPLPIVEVMQLVGQDSLVVRHLAQAAPQRLGDLCFRGRARLDEAREVVGVQVKTISSSSE